MPETAPVTTPPFVHILFPSSLLEILSLVVGGRKADEGMVIGEVCFQRHSASSCVLALILVIVFLCAWDYNLRIYTAIYRRRASAAAPQEK